ncbi:glycosyltransferase family 4 protein [Aquisalinus flavus]|uniref:Glycosyltransferase WbpL n=1 Tax=Aquisalinus flavus TaxID=1526572 RepID=A0A8J2V6R6_9PROT|nr:hypothetical protein [Aquisalinus flavus]MBD0426763.1 hypothetical protein [Aquisalinus flavus]UNE46619.1 hypothetical protein FF099_00360 [Aquisalinus flavus]GGC95810.1 glycosyltransferase WbpL [Aquisalinus flavus]
MFSSASILYFVLIGLGLSGAFLCTALCRTFISLSFLPNHEDERTSHRGTVSRAGGIAIHVSFIVAALLGLWLSRVGVGSDYGVLVVMTGAMALIGLIDDAATISPGMKFIGQIVLSVAFVLLTGPIETMPLPVLGTTDLGIMGYAVAILWVAAFVNVYNFMDGLNGMAAGTALIALIVLCLVGAFGGNLPLFLVSLMMVMSLFAFFIINFPAGNIFMGDAGSLGTGFFIAGLALLAAQPSTGGASFPVTLVPMIFLPFILDVSITLIRRVLTGRRFYRAHREHYYQRLNQAGWSHANVTRLFMVAAIFSAAAGWLITQIPGPMEWMGALALALVLIVSARIIRVRAWRGQRRAQEEESPAASERQEAPASAE